MKKNKTRTIQDSIIAMADPLFDIGLFKNPQIAKRVLAKVAADVFAQNEDRSEALKKFDEFISGRVEPKFDEKANMWGMLPKISEGITYWIIPLEKKISKEEERERSKQLSKELLTIGPDASIRSLCRFFLLSSEEKRTEYIDEAEKELFKDLKK